MRYAATRAPNGGNKRYFKHQSVGNINAKGSFSKLKISQTLFSSL